MESMRFCIQVGMPSATDFLLLQVSAIIKGTARSNKTGFIKNCLGDKIYLQFTKITFWKRAILLTKSGSFAGVGTGVQAASTLCGINSLQWVVQMVVMEDGEVISF